MDPITVTCIVYNSILAHYYSCYFVIMYIIIIDIVINEWALIMLGQLNHKSTMGGGVNVNQFVIKSKYWYDKMEELHAHGIHIGLQTLHYSTCIL